MGSTAWDGQDQAMASTGDEDFHQFLDMSGMANLGDGMHFDFQGFQDGSAQGLMNQPRDAHDTIMTDTENPGLMSAATSMPMSTSTGQPTIPAHMMTPASDPISNIDAQIQYLQQQKFQQQQRQMQEQQAVFFHNHNHSVPPTPQSLEMPNSGQFYSQAEQVTQAGAYDRGYHRLKEQQDMAFTPLVSPAVTPLDPNFSMDNGFNTVPGAYFSPLTSPALIAQNDHTVIYDQRHTNTNNSPIEMDLENAAPPVLSALDLSKTARKKAATKSRGKTSIRSSPIVKAQRRKIGPSPAIVSQVLNEVDESNGAFLPMPATSTETSAEENSSVSPEALSSEMPPPPIPNRRSTSKSPYIQAQRGGQQTPVSAPVDSHPAPATPASLMKLPASKANKQAAGHHEPAVSEHIESLELPESVSGKTLAPVTSRATVQSPSLESNPGKGSGFQPLPSPVFPKPSGPASASASPLLAPGSSGPSARKTPQLAPRSSRKRSTGSVHVSPALLPRISPSIKPLLPGTPGMTPAESAASQLLMSKSNYQNILEGNKVPGVSYPSELSTNLTSKRTSHKIAEQGRRNRINSALQIMAGLLPGGDKGSAGEEGDKKEGKQANSQNSKASVVENAIVHMKNLEQENVDLKNELEELKKQLEGLKGTGDTSAE
ncbi:Phosphorus acquisition-controlling [Fusarium albosuccineum]|uniref:Phosphorus acquisition-controlling n=1 Tax=Fusarium albosuccineum TaxID=1237068 RepID=A0A8H4LPX7_9HYPO|nr:Phosphorus acquisition-controlling [Fusarium albosuccineum]